MTKIVAEIIADSICNSYRITTMKVTFPRIILSEKNTHRMLSKNSASSRAIPLHKMIKMVMTDPFIPLAWQRDHKGMQGTEYIDPTELYSVNDYLPVMQRFLNEFVTGDSERDSAEAFEIYVRLLEKYDHKRMTLAQWWLEARDRVVEVAMLLNMFGVTKQLCNRLLEPFMWHTVLVTATEWENFFHLRCPQYVVGDKVYRSRLDAMTDEQLNGTRFSKSGTHFPANFNHWSDMDWLQINKGQAEIHMMALAEAMWDARNESKPKELQPGEWHIPYCETITLDEESIAASWGIDKNSTLGMIDARELARIKISTAKCAQVSYTIVGEDSKEAPPYVLLDVHNSLVVRPYTNRKGVVFGPDDPIHMSPFEHCNQAMTDDEFQTHVKGIGIDLTSEMGFATDNLNFPDEAHGWCHNYRGWKSYRSMIPNENRR